LSPTGNVSEVLIKTKASTSRILIGESIENLGNYVSGRAILLVDKNVQKLYKDFFKNYDRILIEPGENSKSLDGLKNIYGQLLEKGVDRSWFIIGVGGGVATDIAGFVASTYMRGLRFGFVSTTLLGQVDASIGGKNGINFEGYKNIIGVFRQPEFVICDTEFLKTLPGKELVNGFSEIIKYSLIADLELFDYLDSSYESILALEPSSIHQVIKRCVEIKADIVMRDEKESFERRKLNFGHTIGHAIEKLSGISHGMAVSIGMVAALRISRAVSGLKKEDEERAVSLLRKYGLPTDFSYGIDEIMGAIRKDKKKEIDSIYFVLLEEVGKSVIRKMKFGDLKKVLDDLC